ncbi:MAG TPA: hypothetical protein DCL48_00530, partial [Alphaproteobacteria bacterium]|nr:hypothetical protein [Alphaproteobacteria bacterium]
MRPGVPWSVKDISPEAREAAQVAAQRAGLSLGEWLAQAIAAEAKTVAAFESQRAAPQSPVARFPSPPPQPQTVAAQAQRVQTAFAQPQQITTAQAVPQTRTAYAAAAEQLNEQIRAGEFAVVAHGLRDLADRLDSSERRQQQAISSINQNVAAMADKVDAAERIKLMAETAFATASEAITQSARDQSYAFTHLEETVRTLGGRLDGLEANPMVDGVAREASVRLEQSLTDIKDRISAAEKRGQDAQQALESWVKTFTGRIEAQAATTSELIRHSTQDLARTDDLSGLQQTLAQVQADVSLGQQRDQEKSATLSAIQTAISGLRQELSDSERRAREGLGSFERWVNDVNGRLDQVDSNAAELTMRLSEGARGFASTDQVQRLGDELSAIRTDLRKVADVTAANAAERERTSKDAQAGFDAAVNRLAAQVRDVEQSAQAASRAANDAAVQLSDKLAQTDALVRRMQAATDSNAGAFGERLTQAMAKTDSAVSAIKADLETAEQRMMQVLRDNLRPSDDGSLEILQGAIEQLNANLAKSEQSNSQTAQRQAASIRKVEDMLQGFARGLDSVSDLAKGPLAQPLASVQSTLETITAKIEERDQRAADSLGTMEMALKALAARIEDSERKAGQSTAQIDAALKAVTGRLDAAERNEAARDARLDDSLRDIADRFDDADRKAQDAIDAIETTITGLSQRLDAADRRHKDSI